VDLHLSRGYKPKYAPGTKGDRKNLRRVGGYSRASPQGLPRNHKIQAIEEWGHSMGGVKKEFGEP